MKLVAITIALILLAGCGDEKANETWEYDWSFVHSVSVGHLKDKETGCQYITVGDSAIYPRMDANGKQICK